MRDASAVRSELIDVMSATLDVPVETIHDDFSSERCDNWDSVKHLMLVLAIEDRFGITFDEDEIWTMMSLPELSAAVARRLAPEGQRARS
jgi:acyl carrier protein